MQNTVQERLVAALLAALIVALTGYLLIRGLTVELRGVSDRALALLDLRAPPPPPRPEPYVEPAQSRAARQAPSPRNLKNEATRIVAPPPLIPLPVPTPVIASPHAGVGMAPSNGASNRPGPGEGAGGSGNGLGGGGDGDRDGDDIAPRQIKGRLKPSDLPAALRDAGAGTDVTARYFMAVRYRVEADGHVTNCSVTRTSGDAELDQLICQLIEQRYRFRPSYDSDGEPVRSWVEDTEGWTIDRSENAPAKP